MGRSLIQLCISVLAMVGVWVSVPLGLAHAAPAQLTWLDTPTADTTAFKKAIAPQPWHFPQDFGAHEDYQTEWWYYTGNLETADGRPFGFQLTFFRQALAPTGQPVDAQSHWRGNQVYSAHFTISDIANEAFYPYERFSRGVVGLAGAESPPYQVWLEDWSAAETEPGTVQLQAQTADVGLHLTVQQTRPPVLQGDRGLSVKGVEPGNASYYYSLVQQPTTGTITVHDQTFQVKGVTWKDHEYSTSSLSPGTVGWDWFSVQLDDGAALMLYLLRHEDGTPEQTSAGMFIAADGQQTPLAPQDWSVKVLNTWKSPTSGATYPAKWLITIPTLQLSLQGQALMPNQELNTSTARYWEGAVAFQGDRNDQPLMAKGYVELTGYADRLDSLLSANR
jgi:predicted secreted hydrolase